jgi:hypothetical protein
MVQLCCNGAPPATARLLLSWAPPTTSQPRRARRHCLLPGDVRRRYEAVGDVVSPRVTGFGATEPVGKQDGSRCSVCGRGSDLTLGITRPFVYKACQHITAAIFRFVEVLQVMQQRASATLCQPCGGYPRCHDCRHGTTAPRIDHSTWTLGDSKG